MKLLKNLKRSLVLLLILTYTSYTYSQEVAVYNPMFNKLYGQIENPLNIFVENVDFSELYLTTDNGKIIKDSCQFKIRPKWFFNTTVYIHQIKEKDTFQIAQKHFSVYPAPKPVAKVGGTTAMRVLKNWLLAQQGVSLNFGGLRFDNHLVTKYSVTIMRENKPVFEETVQGAYFTNTIKEKFQSLQKNDIVSFTNIYGVNLKSKEVKIDNDINIKILK